MGLHAELGPILARLLPRAGLPAVGRLLDLGCGDGAKWPLYRAALGPGVALLGVDHDRGALGALRPALCADALALPLRDGALDGAICVAALGLMDDQRRALAELRRALRPGAPALVVTAERRWALVQRWPALLGPELLGQIGALALPAPHPDALGDLPGRCGAAGLAPIGAAAFMLEAGLTPAAAELALLPWEALRQQAAPLLTPAQLAACEQAPADLELASVALAVVSTR